MSAKAAIQASGIYQGILVFIQGHSFIWKTLLPICCFVPLVEKAFYDPSVLELLYFPDDQK
jgi:hypothetical protein